MQTIFAQCGAFYRANAPQPIRYMRYMRYMRQCAITNMTIIHRLNWCAQVKSSLTLSFGSQAIRFAHKISKLAQGSKPARCYG